MHEAVPELVTLHLWRVVPPVSRDLAPVGGGAAGSVDGRDPLA